jgi:hypothetical protein
MKWHQADAKPVTIEASTLARQLANDEPKCANCKHWSSEGNEPVRPCLNGMLPRYTGLTTIARFTTDLSVCSKWEAK